MVWIHFVTEGPRTTLMNPMTPAKMLRVFGELGLREGDEVLDIGAGKCLPALMLASEFGCRVTAVDPFAEFLDEGREEVAKAGFSDRFEFITKPATDVAFEPGRYALAMCLGATFAFGSLEATLAALTPAIRTDGHVLCGEPFKRHPDASEPGPPHDHSLAEIIALYEQHGLAVTSIARSSDDDWDEYQSVRVRNLLDWVRDNPGHADIDDVRGWRRSHAEGLVGQEMGWAIVAGRKAPYA